MHGNTVDSRRHRRTRFTLPPLIILWLVARLDLEKAILNSRSALTGGFL
jgi:hypothetical protein